MQFAMIKTPEVDKLLQCNKGMAVCESGMHCIFTNCVTEVAADTAPSISIHAACNSIPLVSTSVSSCTAVYKLYS